MEVRTEESLGISEEDSQEPLFNVTLSVKDLFDLNPQSKSEAEISLMALGSLFIVLLLKHCPLIFSFSPTICKYLRMVVEVKLVLYHFL